MTQNLNRTSDELIGEVAGEGDDEQGARRSVHHSCLDGRDSSIDNNRGATTPPLQPTATATSDQHRYG